AAVHAGRTSGWGRSMHFQSARLCVLTGSLYVVSGIVSRHFQRNLWPADGQLAWPAIRRELQEHLRFKRPLPEDAHRYNALQRLTYLAVVFGLFPLMIWTGMAMSPAVTSVYPFFVELSGGFQSARTIHFFAANALVLFVVIHIVMVWRAGFVSRTRAMVTGRAAGATALPEERRHGLARRT